jgi:hypothetical protein
MTALPAARPNHAQSRVNDGEIAGSGEAAGSALSGFEAPLRLIDDIDAALAAHNAVVAMATAQ